jgi:GDP-4-dehydro-6-deoxy-D-mannose reductase
MKVLITGANGFIAKTLISHFIQAEDSELVLCSRSFSGSEFENEKYSRSRLHFYQVPDNDFRQVFEDHTIDYIFHTSSQSSQKISWINPLETCQTNISGILNLLDCIRRSKFRNTRLIFFSSSSVYAETRDNSPIREGSFLMPKSPYAISKLTGEYLCKSYSAAYGIDVVIVRPFFITGPGKLGDVCSDWARRVVELECERGTVLEVGSIEGIARDFLHIDDAVAGLDRIVRYADSGEEYNLCSGLPTSLSSLLDIFINQSKIDFSIKIIEEVGRELNEKVKYGSNEKLRKLGWIPKKSVEDIVRSMLEWYR